MAVTLAANTIPGGMRAGSPIAFVDVDVDQNTNALSTAYKVPSDAQVGDLVVVWLAGGGGTSNAIMAGLTNDPMLTNQGNLHGFGTHHCILYTLTGLVTNKSQIGKSLTFTWNYGGLEASFVMIGRTFRYVDTVTPINQFGPGTASTNDVTVISTGSVVVPLANQLVVAVGVGAAINDVGTAIQGVPELYDQIAVGGNGGGFAGAPVGSICMSDGVVDIGYPYTWGTTLMQMLQGSTVVNGAGAGKAIALNPMPKPSAPTLTVTSGGATVPSGGHADAAQQSGAPFSAIIAYTPTNGQGTQEAFLIGRELNVGGGSTGYWNSDDMVWSTTEYWNYRTPTQGATTFTYTFPPSAWADDGTVWKLKVAVKENKLHYSSALTSGFVFTAQAPAIVLTPTVTGTGPKPTVNWTETLDSGATQASWRVRIFTLAQTTATGFDPNVTVPIKDSGYTTGTALTWTLTTSLASGTAYKAYVQVSDSRGMVSNWAASATFTPSYTQPGAGSLVVVLSP